MGFSESDVIDALRVSGNKEGDAVSVLQFQLAFVMSFYLNYAKDTDDNNTEFVQSRTRKQCWTAKGSCIISVRMVAVGH